MMKTPIYYLEERVRSLELHFEDKDNAPTRGAKSTMHAGLMYAKQTLRKNTLVREQLMI